jgi:hypothetical protein
MWKEIGGCTWKGKDPPSDIKSIKSIRNIMTTAVAGTVVTRLQAV